MPHNQHTTSSENQDLRDGKNLEFYLKLTEGWTDPLGPLEISPYNVNGKTISVVRDDLSGVGTKARFGDLLVSKTQEDTLVYVQPRCGYAGISLCYLAKKYQKRLVLFCPAAKEPSDHQRYCQEQGAELRFVRIAAMPVLGGIAREWAARNKACFIPLGLRHELVTAAGVRVAFDLAWQLGYQPSELWVAFSTGVLCRSLQIAWPDTRFRSVAVARNIKDGELGRSLVVSHPFPFLKDEKKDELPPYPSVGNYDAKVWRYVKEFACDGAFVWNVASGITCVTNQQSNPINSERVWGDCSDANF